MKQVSIVVPAHNAEETIAGCLKTIRQSEFSDYELIVVDDGSKDATGAISKEYADKVISLDRNLGLPRARRAGIEAAGAEIIVNIDSDILIKPDTIAKVVGYLSSHQEIDALTGLLARDCPHKSFLGQYKNLYMNYNFKRLPESVSFLYGSIYAIRSKISKLYNSQSSLSEDIEFGQRLISLNKKIAFLKDIEVIHLKEYSPILFIKNDFLVPFSWVRIFLKFKGWKQLFRNKTGFTHISKEQLASVILAPLIFLLGLGILLAGYDFFAFVLLLSLSWVLFNIGFLRFLVKEKGIFFGIFSFFVIFFDNILMASGIICGFISLFIDKINSLSMRKKS
ncbi:MAG: glycosyltransferase family 2 protein [Candidatus Omnitrophica bacterium]|nr:glycosyltransferase family 2 protein [Candidatus Omnitrophota bacterium]